MFGTGCVWVELCGGYGGGPVCITKSENIGHIGSICPLIHLCIYPSVHPSIHPFIDPFIDLSIHLSIYPSIYLPIYLSLYLSISVCEIPVDARWILLLRAKVSGRLWKARALAHFGSGS